MTHPAARPRRALLALALSLALAPGAAAQRPATERPNIVVLFADDLGYGDLSSYGHPTIRTPNLDRMAREGVRLTSFYAAAPVCTPSRAALLTGRYAARSGMTRVLFPRDTAGLPHAEVTLAESLKTRGYRTLAVGKWHLGHRPRFLPTAHGFDRYLGIPYSNDMDRAGEGEPPVPLVRDTATVESPADQATLTERYTEEAIRFMRESRGEPFFVYLAYTMPHLPLFASARFRGRSRAGLYGDVVEALDWSAGEILAALRDLGLDRNTVVVFTSDNGPWQDFPKRLVDEYGSRPWHGGSAGPLRGAKQSTWEGGMRVPAIVRWPGVVPAGEETAEVASTLDLFPTLVRLAGAEIPRDRPIDGRDILPLLTGAAALPPADFFYFRERALEAVRSGPWKLRVSNHARAGVAPGAPPTPELFDLDADPGERYDRAAEHPEIVESLRARMRAFAEQVGASGMPGG